MQLICAFVFAYAESRFSHDAAHAVEMFLKLKGKNKRSMRQVSNYTPGIRSI